MVNKKTWSVGLAEWVEGDTAFLSVVFSWKLPAAYMRAIWYRAQGYRVRAGGPAVTLNPGALADVAELGGLVDALAHHNPDATFTTRGCIRRCSFCAVPKIEGGLVELPDSEWEPKPVICDNNLLASSPAHFDHVIDRLKAARLRGVDFNQGLDARILTDHHAARLAELPGAVIRLAWDNIKTEPLFRAAFSTLTGAGVKPGQVRVYVLIGYRDTPEDALHRLETVRALGALPNPMRYQPLDARRRNEYVDPNWTERELRDFMRYWARQNWLRNIPFAEYRRTSKGGAAGTPLFE
jgi:hypothetical protein